MAVDKPFSGFSAPAAAPEGPLDKLVECHRRLERQCATLQRLVPHLLELGADEQARTMATGVMRYFDTAGKHHHEDEELDLFPALIESMAGSDAVCIRDMTDALTADHRALEPQWQGLRAVLVRVLAGESVTLDVQAVEAFNSTYARHIEREEGELLPMAARLLGVAELEKIGRAMRLRRGIDD